VEGGVKNARDVMTTEIVSVLPDTPTQEIARLLLDKGISAVPVVDRDGAPVGMVSEGDLIGRDDHDREARRDWWLALLAEGEVLSPEFLGHLRTDRRSARDVMAKPVVTVEEEAEVGEIARLLEAHRIKRVPVVRDGRIVGIVSRADLLRALAAEPSPVPARGVPYQAGLFAWVDRNFYHRWHETAGERGVGPSALSGAARVAAADLRALAADFARGELLHREAERRAAADRRRTQVKEFVDHHIEDESWRALLHNARQAAEHGLLELMLLRFPSQLCSDGGRAINAMEPHWPATLRGEAAELYLRWERELKPNGFRLAARVLDFPGGMPGDIGLFLVWGE
jgi:CBS domain-containing protein